MTARQLLTFTTVLILCGTLTNAQDAHVRNFHISGQNRTHITFTWDIVDGQHSSYYIEGFIFFYRERNNPYRSLSLVSPRFDSTIRTNEGRTFSYVITVRNYRLSGPYVMWIGVNRRYYFQSDYYSKQIPVVFGGGVTMEMNIRLWPSETCYEFSSSSISRLSSVEHVYEAVQKELYWVLVTNCQCTLPDIENIVIANGYFTCGSSGYATFRTDIYSTDGKSDAASYRSILTNWLQGENTDKTITIYRRRYSVEPGSCGVTVSSLYAPVCSAASSASSAGVPTSDNTAVIVVSVFAAMFFILALGLIGYIIAARRCQTNSFRRESAAVPSTSPAQATTIKEIPQPSAGQERELEPHQTMDNLLTSTDLTLPTKIFANCHFLYFIYI